MVVKTAVKEGKPSTLRSKQIDLFLSRLNKVDPSKPIGPMDVREMWSNDEILKETKSVKIEKAEKVMSRGRVWFEKLTGISDFEVDDVQSVLCADVELSDEKVRYIAVVDVPSQAYGYKEELLGIFESCAGAVDAYASARYAGHPISWASYIRSIFNTWISSKQNYCIR